MTNQSDWKRELQQIAEKLRDPFTMRMTVAIATVGIMCFAISDPIQGRIRNSNRELNEMKLTVRAAEEVMLLRDHWAAVQDRIMQGKSNDIVVSHLIDVIRNEPVELMRIDTQSPEKLGPLQSIRVMIDVNGSFDALNQLLYRLDTDEYLIRIESVAIKPSSNDQPSSQMNLALRIIKDAT